MHSYAYVADSRLDEARRALGLQTSGGRAPNPRFFTGFLGDSQQAATALLAIAKIAGTRYFQPTNERLRDPVVTCDGDRLRFESFSGCCGVYARLDVLGDALDGEVHDRGTTNVDVNEPLRRALARVTKGDPLHLTVGPDQVEVGTLDGAAVGEIIGRLLELGELAPSRIVPCLRDIAASGAADRVWDVVAAALPKAWSHNRVADLVELAVELAQLLRPGGTVGGLAEVAARKGSSKAVVQARRLVGALA